MISISRKEQLTVVYYIPKCSSGPLDKGRRIKWFGCVLDLIVTVEGNIDPMTGYLLDLKELKRFIKENITDLFDQRLLNDDEIFGQGPVSLEVLAIEIHRRLSVKFLNSDAHIKTVTLKQRPDLEITYNG